ncbi:MAG: hypothetical protein EA373_04580 [Oceanospirillales bacterium]|nr:MAG: hypothetical protein EA373_04580 [Oceanospirillales bacterium]
MNNKLLVSLSLALLFITTPITAQDRLNFERAWSLETEEWEDPISTRLILHTTQQGRLVLLDQHNRELRQEQGSPVWLVYVWQMENEEEIPDQLFYANFFPEDESGTPFQRLLRVTPGTDARFTLINDQGEWIWRSMPDLPQEISLQLSSEKLLHDEQSAWMSANALDDDLNAFWQLLSEVGIEEPTFSDVAADLKAQGFTLIGEGLYAEALLILKQSYDIDPTSDLLDRIKRLEAYVDLQAQ